MKLCHCGHPIIVLAHERQEGQPEPTECACCRTGVHFGPRLVSILTPAGTALRAEVATTDQEYERGIIYLTTPGK